jgi:hypothetical protein
MGDGRVLAGGLGACVTGVSRAAKADFVRSLGAERVVAYELTFIINRERQADLERRGRLVNDGTVKPALDTVYP